jgi:hypothetical protein
MQFRPGGDQRSPAEIKQTMDANKAGRERAVKEGNQGNVTSK